jgi:argininosuccinate lyase
MTENAKGAEAPDAAGTGKGMWGGRFTGGMAPEMAALNLSLTVDGRLWREDIRGSLAWAEALEGAGVITEEECAALLRGLHEVAQRIEREGLAEAPEEDIHSVVERMLREAAGAVAGKLHTGRSRNDQSATDVRLWGMAAAEELTRRVDHLVAALAHLAEQGIDHVMPGYTHLQQGQPIRAAQWALSHAWAFLRDRERLRAARRATAVLPLGSGAIAGCPFPVDREGLRAALGFDRISENSVDAVSDRDWICDVIYAGAMLGVHLSRLGEDMVLFSSMELGFLRLSDGFSTGSSLMPQKRNPDAAELTRGKAARLLGNLQAVLTLLKGLPTGYNRDLQEDKIPLFDSVDTLLMVLPAAAGAVESARFRPERMTAAMDPQLLRRGVPFRESHEIIGRLVRRAEEAGTGLDQLSTEAFREEHSAFGEDVRDVFDWLRSADSRDTDGGTSRRAILAQLEEIHRRLDRG